MQYEYKIISNDTETKFERDVMQVKLNELGKEGYKIEASCYTQTSYILKLVLMREIKPEERSEINERKLEPEL